MHHFESCVLLVFPWAQAHPNTSDQHMSFLCAVHDAREVFHKVRRKGVGGVGPLDQDQKGVLQ